VNISPVGDVTHFDLFGFPFADPVVWESEGEDKNKSLATAGFRKSNPEKYDGGEQKVVQQQTEETTYEAMTVEEFKKNTLSDMYAQVCNLHGLQVLQTLFCNSEMKDCL
jgi:hypothetical protein